MEVVAQQTIRATADGQLLPVSFSYIPQTPGECRLTLEAAEQPGELVTTNNRLSTFVHVLKGGLNVLYLEGALRVEQKFIRRALDSSPDIKVDYVRIDPRDPKTRPPDLADRFKPGKYDVYILGDIDSTAFSGDELADLAKCVSRGAGLMMLGGFQSFGAGGYGETPLAKVLPVGMDRLERQQPDEPLRTDLHWPGPLAMQPTPLGLMHFALMLAGNRQENAALWAKLPPLEGANKFHDLAPGAVVLAAGGLDKPLLVAHNYGDGRVMAFAGDSTWRWWMHGYESAFKRFWRQIVLWLARKDQAQEGNVWIRLAQRRFAPSQRVEFAVGANAPSGEPLADAAYKAEVVLPDGARRPLPLVRQEEQMAGSFRDTQTRRRLRRRSVGHPERPAVGQHPGAVPRLSAGPGVGQCLGRRADDGESGRDDRRPVVGPRAVARAHQTSRRGDATPRRAAGDEEHVLGHVAVLLDDRLSARSGVVFAEAMGVGVGGRWFGRLARIRKSGKLGQKGTTLCCAGLGTHATTRWWWLLGGRV